MKPRKGFTLLEVMLALAILVGAVAVLGEFGRLGLRSAKSSRDSTRAQLLCESIMSQITAGILTPNSVQGVPIVDPSQGTSVNGAQADDFGNWVYSIDTETIDEDGLIAVTVTVMQDLPNVQRPASFSLIRWIPDPGLESSESDTTSESTQSSTGAG